MIDQGIEHQSYIMKTSKQILLGLSVLLAGCYPDQPVKIDQYDIVITQYDRGFNFSGSSTYVIIDSVWHTNSQNDNSINRNSDALILSALKTNMNKLGYMEVTNTNQIPDFIVRASAFSNKYDEYYCSTYSNSNWGWWGGWNSYYGYNSSYSTYGYSYSWCGYSGYYYESGTVLLEIVDTKNPVNSQFKVVWNGLINGVVSNSATYNQQTISERINQAFTQSTYLKK
jgi:hypothetical protein